MLRLLPALFLSACAAGLSGAPHVVLISGEDEYQSARTLPAFQKVLESVHGFRCTFLQRTSTTNLPGLEALETADLAIFYIRRMTLPEDQLGRIQRYVRSGKPLVALRTSSHAFENWKEFDPVVLGGNYGRHHGNQLVATARIPEEAAGHPVLRGVSSEFVTGGSLYRTSPLKAGTTLLLVGSVEGQKPEPMAWTHLHLGGRVFYTSLGHPRDFENRDFQRLLVNGIFWALNKPPPDPVSESGK